MWSVLYSQSEIWRAQSRKFEPSGLCFMRVSLFVSTNLFSAAAAASALPVAQTDISLSRAMRSNSPHPLNGPLVRRSSNASPAFAHCSRATLRLTENDSFDSEPSAWPMRDLIGAYKAASV